MAGLVIDALDRADPNAPAMREIGMFDLAWVGVPVAVAGIVFVMLTSRCLLPDSRESSVDFAMRRRFGAEFRVEAGSPLVGQQLKASGLLGVPDFELVGLIRADDALLISCIAEALPGLWRTDGLTPYIVSGRLGEDRYRHSLVEVALSRRSMFLGKKMEGPDPDSPYKANVIATSRGGLPVGGRLREIVPQAGDIIVAEVGDAFFFENRNEVEFSMTRRLTREKIQRREKAAAATLITTAMVVVVALGWMSMLNAALLASGLMVLSGLPLARFRGAQRGVLHADRHRQRDRPRIVGDRHRSLRGDRGGTGQHRRR